ncbi:hypothetical protein FNH22_23160 [Fulvivirga sp. M361]|uniref:RHS repeat-associated core domain-containing protein n=1 Tax=Fulvivirga sp. M361 TaxID=2594266 RepID=UPI00117A19EF|nr:RHS repeat-associated core domain-containing protein [Fulvivirga sp. M361]TRX51856.1 hypothetical protein FNH22_23160 [Fulvivirga sp. M361]
MSFVHKILTIITLTLLVSYTFSTPVPIADERVMINIVPDDREIAALRDLYQSADGTQWLNPWPSPDTWAGSLEDGVWQELDGVTVLNGDIVQLNLQGKGLRGELPDVLGELTALSSLNLGGNVGLRFPNGFPSWLCNLASLEVVDFYNVPLRDVIPDCFFTNLTGLRSIYFGRCALNGEIPENIGDATELKSVFLQENALTGNLPSSLGNLNGLESFRAFSNQLSGPIPDEIVQAPRLVTFNVANNDLTALPDFTTHNRPNILALSVINNRLDLNSLVKNATGVDTHPFGVFGFTPQKEVPFGTSNEFTFLEGQDLTLVAHEMDPQTVIQWERRLGDGSWQDVTGLDTDNARNTFTIQRADEAHAGMYRYHTTHPWLPGLTITSREAHAIMSDAVTVSDEVELTALRDLYNSTNGAGWTTPWPSPETWPESLEEGVWTDLEGVTVEYGDIVSISLYGRNLTGTLPPSLGNLQELRTIDFGGNTRLSFPEGFPLWLCNLTALESIAFYNVAFNGAISECLFANLTNLRSIYFGRCSLTGEIPENIGNASQLKSIFLQENRLTGNLPVSLGNLTSMESFRAFNNQLSGPIPDEILRIRRLVFFNVADNKLTSMPNLRTHSNVRNLQLGLQQNQIGFGTIEPNFTDVDTHPYGFLALYGQMNVPINSEGEVIFNEGGTLIITSQDIGQLTEVFWEKKSGSDWVDISHTDEASENHVYTLSDAGEEATGLYRYRAVNPWISGLEIISAPVSVKMSQSAPDPGYVPKQMYDGNITALAWHTREVEGVPNSASSGVYLFDYDQQYQLEGAQWAQPDPVFQEYSVNSNEFRVNNLTYDKNGNITNLWRSDSNGVIRDKFSYEYNTAIDIQQNNQLQYIAGHSHYHYNEIGEMIYEDSELDSLDKYVKYNMEGKVTGIYSKAVQTSDGSWIYNEADLKVSFEYDDRGFRILKKNHETEWETWYVRDASGKLVSIYEKPDPDGIVTQTEIPVYGAKKLGVYYPQQDGSVAYELTDHLGNVRGVMKRIVNSFTATMEDNGQAVYSNPRVGEVAFFDNIAETALGDNRTGWNRTPASNAVPMPNKSAFLPGDGIVEESMGPAIALKVQPGDNISLSVYGKLLGPEGGSSGKLAVSELASMLHSTTINAVGEQVISHGTIPLASLTGFFAGKEIMALASLNYIILDNDFNLINSGYEYMSEEAIVDPLTLDDDQWTRLETSLHVTEPGYVYIFINNESVGIDAIFDDMNVIMTGDRLVRSTDYYPYGSVMSSAVMDQEDNYRFGYQGLFSEKDHETGWNNFEARQYDPVIGRWTTIDPDGQFDSPYLAYANNPIIFVDPDGRFVGTIIGGVVGGFSDGEWNWNNALKGALVGAVADATFTAIILSAGTATPFVVPVAAQTVVLAGAAAGAMATATDDLLNNNGFNPMKIVKGATLGGATAGLGRWIVKGARGLASKPNKTPEIVVDKIKQVPLEPKLTSNERYLLEQMHYLTVKRNGILNRLKFLRDTNRKLSPERLQEYHQELDLYNAQLDKAVELFYKLD